MEEVTKTPKALTPNEQMGSERGAKNSWRRVEAVSTSFIPLEDDGSIASSLLLQRCSLVSHQYVPPEFPSKEGFSLCRADA